MKTRLLALTTAVTLAAAAALPAQADTSEVTLAWQEPGYVEEVVVVTAPRPKREDAVAADIATAAADEVTLAWQRPGYVEEVVVVTASRSEVLENAWRTLAARWHRTIERSSRVL